MKLKKFLAVALIGVMAFSLVACGEKESSNDTTNENTTNENITNESTTNEDTKNMQDLSGTIVITGSTSVEKILNDMIDEFTALNPDVSINYTGTGSSAGITDTLAGTNTIGVSSREIKEEEKTNDLVGDAFAYDGIAVVVNPANKVTDISKDNLAKIFSGEVTNWNQIGGNDADIVVVSREGSSGTRSAFEELIKLEDAGGLTESAAVVEGNGNAQTTVAGNENAIGYVSFSFIDSTIKALTVDGVVANADNAKEGTYALSRPFLFAYMGNAISPEAKAFIEFAKSEEGQTFVEEHGGIKIN